MTLLLHISDTHFGTERPAVVAALERLARQRKPDLLLLTGDITQRATAEQFAAARAFVDRLGVPQRLVLPGNHDIPLFNLGLRLLMPYARFQHAFGNELEPSAETTDVLVLGLNTTRWWRHADGELSTEQIDRVAQRLQADGGRRWKLVLVHQPLAVTQASDLKNRLHGHAQAIARWRQAGCDLVLGGHIHLPFVLPLPAADVPVTRRALPWVVQAGTAVSHRLRAGAGNSVNLLQLQAGPPRRGVVQRWDYQDAQDAFVCVATHTLPAG